jgi:hypothetical protein
MKTKNLKPIEIDAQFKYMCPQSTCGYCHWISIKEAQTKNFKIVCDCGYVFKPKRIQKIKILYDKPVIKQLDTSVVKTVVESVEAKTPLVVKQFIPDTLLNKCSKTLIGYGFTEQESKKLLSSAYTDNPTENIGELIKFALKKVGELNNV